MKKIYSKKSGSKLEEHLEEFLSNVHDGVLAFDDYDRYSDDEIRRKKVRILCDKESLKPIAAEAEGILEDLAVIGRKMRSADGVKPDFDEREDEIIMHYVFFESIPPEDLIPPELEEKLDTIVFIEEIEKELIRGEEVAADEMELYEMYKNTSLTTEEKNLLDRNRRALQLDADMRVGVSPYNVCLIRRAKRYCKLEELQAPEILRSREALRFFEHFVLHRLFLTGKALFVKEDEE